MRFLISNYSTPWFTEPYYFNAGLSLLENCESHIFNPQQSVYDNFDKINPNIFITHINQINKDVIHYLKNNSRIQLVANVNNVEREKISKIYDYLKSENINLMLFGADDPNVETKFAKIAESADIFLQRSENRYQIQKLIFINQEEDIIDVDYPCHYTTIKENLYNIVDFALPINGLNTIFNNYNEIVFKGDFYIGSQISFNAIFSGTKVIFDTKESKNLDKIDNIFKNQKLLSSVKSRHTCLHRLKSLLTFLSCSDLSKQLDNEINKI